MLNPTPGRISRPRPPACMALAGLLCCLFAAPTWADTPPARPTDEECRAGYPAMLQVERATPIAYHDIAAAKPPPPADAAADTAATATGDAAPPEDAAGTAPAGAATQNRAAQKAASDESAPSASSVARLRHGLAVQVRELPALVRLLECVSKPRRIVLFLAGRPIPGLTAFPPTDPQRGQIIFLLERSGSQETAAAWSDLLGRPTFNSRNVNVSVGFDDSYPIPSKAVVALETIPAGWAALWCAIMIAILGLVIWAGRRTGMLRDFGSATGMFSLARIQLTFWTVIVLGSVVFIGMITGDYLTTLNEEVLVLLGISVGTSLGSSILDKGTAANRQGAAVASTGHWWKDILSDGRDVSVHRLQMAAWTVVLGIVFIHQVYSRLAMPAIPTALLALMGISSGTYLSLKATQE